MLRNPRTLLVCLLHASLIMSGAGVRVQSRVELFGQFINPIEILPSADQSKMNSYALKHPADRQDHQDGWIDLEILYKKDASQTQEVQVEIPDHPKRQLSLTVKDKLSLEVKFLGEDALQEETFEVTFKDIDGSLEVAENETSVSKRILSDDVADECQPTERGDAECGLKKQGDVCKLWNGRYKCGMSSLTFWKYMFGAAGSAVTSCLLWRFRNAILKFFGLNNILPAMGLGEEQAPEWSIMRDGNWDKLPKDANSYILQMQKENKKIVTIGLKNKGVGERHDIVRFNDDHQNTKKSTVMVQYSAVNDERRRMVYRDRRNMPSHRSNEWDKHVKNNFPASNNRTGPHITVEENFPVPPVDPPQTPSWYLWTASSPDRGIWQAFYNKERDHWKHMMPQHAWKCEEAFQKKEGQVDLYNVPEGLRFKQYKLDINAKTLTSLDGVEVFQVKVEGEPRYSNSPPPGKWAIEIPQKGWLQMPDDVSTFLAEKKGTFESVKVALPKDFTSETSPSWEPEQRDNYIYFNQPGSDHAATNKITAMVQVSRTDSHARRPVFRVGEIPEHRENEWKNTKKNLKARTQSGNATVEFTIEDLIRQKRVPQGNSPKWYVYQPPARDYWQYWNNTSYTGGWVEMTPQHSEKCEDAYLNGQDQRVLLEAVPKEFDVYTMNFLTKTLSNQSQTFKVELPEVYDRGVYAVNPPIVPLVHAPHDNVYNRGLYAMNPPIVPLVQAPYDNNAYQGVIELEQINVIAKDQVSQQPNFARSPTAVSAEQPQHQQ